MPRIPDKLVAAADAIAALTVAAWVGGHVALGAFAARTLFRDLPRELASSAMTTVFRSFDGLANVAITVLIVWLLFRVVLQGRRVLQGAEFACFAAGNALVIVGLVAACYVHPEIERLFRAGDTLSPHFAFVHHLSERLAYSEVLAAIVFFFSFTLARTRSAQQ